MKKFLKRLVVLVLARQVRKLRRKHQFKMIGVVGSIGKTSTKLAIAQTLEKSTRVRYQDGNYNDLVSVPLIFFGQAMPSLTNPIAWVKIFLSNQKQINQPYPYDVVVVELGTDGPGQIDDFKTYLELDFVVITSIAPEHMEYFGNLEAVAKEELSVLAFSKLAIFNTDIMTEEARQMIPADSISYSLSDPTASYHMANVYSSSNGFEGDIKQGTNIFLHVSHEFVFETQLYSLLAAVIVGKELGLKSTQILSGLSNIHPVSGRLRRLRGINNSTIIDDTYNASPDAIKAGIKMLYKLKASQKIAILGNMNELGAMSARAHKEIGELCDPKQINLLVTIGPDANAHLAPAAEAKGCTVKKFDNPYEAGEYVQSKVEPDAVIFAKGSQNGVFAEEAVKLLLADQEDSQKLVRQSEYWLKRKSANFKRNK